MVLALHFATWITSLEETSVASSVILVTSHPLFVAIMSHYMFKERLKAIGYVGIIVAFSGIIVLSLGDLDMGGSNFRGDILAIIGSIAAGTYILGGRKSRRKVPLVPYVFIVYGICTVCLLVACIIFSVPLHPLPLKEYELFILMAIIPTIFGHTLYNYALKYVKAQVVSVSRRECAGAQIDTFHDIHIDDAQDAAVDVFNMKRLVQFQPVEQHQNLVMLPAADFEGRGKIVR